MNIQHLISQGSGRDVTYLATPLDEVTKYIQPWTTGMIILGAVILGGCLAWAAVSMGARAAAAKKGDNTHMREGIGKIVSILFAGFFLGMSLIVIALAIKLGQNAPKA